MIPGERAHPAGGEEVLEVGRADAGRHCTVSVDTALAASITAEPGTIFRSARLPRDPLPAPKLVAPAANVNALPPLSANTKVPAGSATTSPPEDPAGSDAAGPQLPSARCQE